MHTIPAEVYLSWPKPNYVNPESRVHSAIVCSSICMAVITLVISARLYTRAVVVRWFGADDWLAIPAAVTGVGYCIATILSAQHGWYKHTWDMPLTQVGPSLKYVVCAALLGLLNVGFIKLSILCLYRRLTPEPWFRVMTHIVMGLVIAWMVAMAVTNFLICIPLHAYWDIKYKGPQTCFVLTPYFVSFSAIDLALDVTVWSMPLFFIVPMRLPRRQKWTLFGTFAIGLLTIVAAALRLPSLARTSASFDWSWEIWHAAIWTQIEAAVGVFCASVPTFKPLVARYAPSVLGSSAGSKGNGKNSHGSNSSSNTNTTGVSQVTTDGDTLCDRKRSDTTKKGGQDEQDEHDEELFDFP